MSNLFSPLDTRYAKDLPVSLSEQGALEAQVEVERVWLLQLMREGLCPRVSDARLKQIFKNLSFAEIEAIERTTQHATRALVEALAARLHKSRQPRERALAEWVHVGLTSFDTVDTAQRLRLKRFLQQDFLPQVQALKLELRRWARKHAGTLQAGRTHGQFAVPTYFGVHFAEAHARIVEIEARLAQDIEALSGQASGAVGGYNAPGLLLKDPLKTEEKFLAELGLKPHYGSTQILPPEDIFLCASSVSALCSVVAKVANDLRHLARSEIGEISEGMAPGQVGSSTMPQKRNPWNFEHVCSLWKVLQSRMMLLQMDMVSEHQRDLTNSASGRFHLEVFAVAQLMCARLTRTLSRMQAHPQQMKRNMQAAGGSIYAEALYVLAAKHGVADAHSVVRQAARAGEASGRDLLDELKRAKVLPPALSKGLNAARLQEEALRGTRLKLKALMKGWRN